MLLPAPKSARRFLFFLVAPLALAGCSPLTSSFLDPYGPIAAIQRSLFFDVVGLMLIVVVPVFVMVPWFACRFRRSNASAPYRPDWAFFWPLEIAIWGVPIVIVAILSALVWSREIPLDPYAALPSRQPPLEIQVVGLDWKWLFIYPDERIATVGEVGLPTGRAVRFRLTSDTVMQSFFIPALGSQIYAMAGMVTDLNLKADRAGRVRGANTQYNGSGFPQQRFAVSIMAPQDFSAWVTTIRANGVPLDGAAYALLSQQGTAAQARARLGAKQMPASALYFSNVAPGLFHGIVGKYRHVAESGH
jgi:cytochrome o ubiquinol oxidase subunit 2